MTDAPRRHLFIAGTGRAGTSFLVRLLAELGLETHLDRATAASWHEDAAAGLEDLPLPGNEAALPYVVKTPWLHEVIGGVLANPAVGIDAVVIPIRRLADAAASRIVVERQAMHRRAPWLAALAPWTSWGAAPGGVVYSLHAHDQARVLAVGLHLLLERLVAADVPVVLLEFPRLARDPGYLHRRLGPVLPGITEAAMLAAHARVFDPARLRVEAEHAAEDPEAAALRREIAAERRARDAAEQRLAEARAEAALLRASTSWRLTAPLRTLGRLFGRR